MRWQWLIFVPLVVIAAEDPPLHLSEFQRQNPISKDALAWDWGTWNQITVGKSGVPQLRLKGEVGGDYLLTVNGQHAFRGGPFEWELDISKSGQQVELLIQEGTDTPTSHAFAIHWLESCPAFGVAFLDDKKNQTRAFLQGKFPAEQCIQLTWISAPPQVETTPWWRNFSVGALASLASSNRNSFSPYLGWRPTWPLGKSFLLEGDLSFTLIRLDAANLSPAAWYTLAAVKPLGDIEVAMGAGLQSWFSSLGGTHPEFFTEFRYRFAEPWWLIRKMGIGYTLYFPSGYQVHQFKVAVLFDLSS